MVRTIFASRSDAVKSVAQADVWGNRWAARFNHSGVILAKSLQEWSRGFYRAIPFPVTS
jgi:hypothetical protein